MPRSRVLVVGINYAPETTGIAPYTAGMARALAAEHDVTVVTAHPHYPQWRVADGYGGWRRAERVDEVDVVRLRHYVPSDPTGASRILSEMTFALRTGLARVPRPDAVVVVTPALLPIGPVLARARAWKVPVGVVVQDLYAKAATEIGLLGGRMDKVLGRTEARLLRSATGVVSIHERMADAIVRDYGVARDAVTVIPNWTHISGSTSDRVLTRKRLGWDDEFVVLHAGNMGAKQGLEHVVTAARRADQRTDDLRFVLMGDGARRRELEEAAAGVERLRFMAPVGNEEFADVLAAADVLLLHERPGLKEMCAPSKLTSYFAASRPVLAATDAESAAAYEVSASRAGTVVVPGDADALLDGIDELRDVDRDELGRRGTTYAAERLSETAAFDGYRGWVRSLLASRR